MKFTPKYSWMTIICSFRVGFWSFPTTALPPDDISFRKPVCAFHAYDATCRGISSAKVSTVLNNVFMS